MEPVPASAPASPETVKAALGDPRRVSTIVTCGAFAMALAAFSVERAIRGQPHVGAIGFVAYVLLFSTLIDRLERFALSDK